MKSIRNLITVVVMIVIILIGFGMIVNNYYFKPILFIWNEINNNIIEFNEVFIEADINIRIINNVTTQFASSVEIDETRYNRIMEAYEENHSSLIEKLEQINAINTINLEYSSKLNQYALLNRFVDFKSLENSHKTIRNKIEELNNSVVALENIEMYNQQPFIDDVYELYTELRIPIKDLRNQYNETNQSVIPFLGRSINLIFIILFVIILILSVLLNKIIKKDIKYMMDSLGMLSRNEYDITKLPKLKGEFYEEKVIGEFVEDIFKERTFLNNIRNIVSKEYILDEIIDKLLLLVKETLNTDRIGIAFIDYKNNKIVAEHGAFNYGKVLLGPGFNVEFNETRLTSIINSKLPSITNSIKDELQLRPNSKSLKLLKEEGIKSNMVIPLIINNDVYGFLFFSSIREYNFNEKSLQIGEKIAYEISNVIDRSYLTKKMFSTVTKTFANLVEKRDNDTGDHINRMTAYSKAIAEELVHHKDFNYRVSNSFVNDISNYASIHDIGKIGIEDSILKKPGKLTEEERQIMQTHASIGAEILLELEQSLKIFNKGFYKNAIDIAHFHHERWDGKGYPMGLVEDDIPLSARIVAIADVFDALSSKRVYKDSFGFENSIRIINESAGTQFDPELVKVFNSILPKIRSIYDNSNFERQKAIS